MHRSLPVYSGGLGVLAGDILKSASDLAHPTVGVGLLYRTGYFHQRIDTAGLQHEYWLDTDPDLLPAVRVTGADGAPVTVRVPVDDEDVVAQVWRVDVGRVPLYLLDSDLADNGPVGRWVTSRLYEANRSIRLAQYAMLGVGAVRALRALQIEPSVYHLNEGHPALAALCLAAERVAAGLEPEQAWAEARARLVFTTHTPVPAGNETYSRTELEGMLGRLADLAGDRERFFAMGRIDPSDAAQPSGLTAFALRASRSANGVSRRHGEVARRMWQPVLGGTTADDVPIGHVTNGVHVPTWLHGPMRHLLDRHLGAGWIHRSADPATWVPVAAIPAAEIWAARTEARAVLVDRLGEQATSDRLRRGEDLAYAEAAEHGFGPERLTVGFARRLATYKRLYLVAADPGRAMALLTGERSLQFVFAGKAHPSDAGAKDIVRRLFDLKGAALDAGTVAFLEDYDLALAAELVAGCDVWVNLPRPPQEASGTSGMKACLNGGLHLSVLDGWWAEAYDGTNGWAIDGAEDPDEAGQDRRDAAALFDLLEHQVVPEFHDRGDDGIPHRWVERIRRSLITNGPAFSADRMVRQYADEVYPPPGSERHGHGGEDDRFAMPWALGGDER
ncbi:MAG: alpha-glucan family phosphorylase [Acidimicrobiales bacterium]